MAVKKSAIPNRIVFGLIDPFRRTDTADADDAHIELLIEMLEICAQQSAYAVFIGVAVELLLALVHWFSLFKLPIEVSAEQWGGLIADALVALGVGGEILFSKKSSSLQRSLVTRSNLRLATAEREAGVAHERAAKAEKDAAEANARAMDAKLALENFRAPRIISGEALDALREKASRFPGMVADAITVNANMETRRFSSLLCSLLNSSGWQVESFDMDSGAAEKVTIVIRPNPEPSEHNAAHDLHFSLVAAGIEAFLNYSRPRDDWNFPGGSYSNANMERITNPAPIRIFIGAK